jgi:hypothetical protein
MVIGGQAVLLYGEPRLTKDIDITLGVGAEELLKILAMMKGLGLQSLVEDPKGFVKQTMVLPLVNEEPNIRVDLIFSHTPYERQAIARAIDVPIEGTTVKFASIEDVVIHKIVAGRPRDIEDVKAILLKQSNYDRTYIGQWLAEFDRSLDEKYSEVFHKVVEEIQ